jgi:hypothetical protein
VLASPGARYFDKHAVHVAVVDAPLRRVRRTAGRGISTEASLLRLLASQGTALQPFDAVLTSDALHEGVLRLCLAGFTGWPSPSSGINPSLASALAVQERVSRSASEPLAWVDAGWRLAFSSGAAEGEWASHAAAARIAAEGPQRGGRSARTTRKEAPTCSSLEGEPLPAGLPPGAGSDGGGFVEPLSETDWPDDHPRRQPAPTLPPFVTSPVALCASVLDGELFLDEWLRFHLSAGVARAYIHDDASTDGTAASLERWRRLGGFVTPLAPLHGPTRFGVSQRTAAGGWSGQREVLGRCLTHALLDRVHWLLSADLDEFFLPRRPAASLSEALASMERAVCVTVRRHGASCQHV